MMGYKQVGSNGSDLPRPLAWQGLEVSIEYQHSPAITITPQWSLSSCSAPRQSRRVAGRASTEQSIHPNARFHTLLAVVKLGSSG